ncbi:MAG: AAA family ATPase [Candidatus Levybacteria bacterium]|nr:AAA family ATPase [Candidatus Levybacteria bacterium]
MSDNTMIEKNIGQIADRGSRHMPTREVPKLSATERAEQLWGLYSEYITFRRSLYKEGLSSIKGEGQIRDIPAEKTQLEREKVASNPLVQKVEGEISSLWQDPQVQAIFKTKVRESLAEQETHKLGIKEFEGKIAQKNALENTYFDLLRNQFLMRQMIPTLRSMEIFANRTEGKRVQEEIKNLEENGGMDPKEKDDKHGLDKEHADLSALLSYERVRDYHKQFRQTGVIFTPSRLNLLDKVLTKTANGTWMQLIGETGTGKTTFAKRASGILNNEPAQYASGERFGDVRALIGKQVVDQVETYYQFGPLTIALTGCLNSREMEKAIKDNTKVSGKLLILDELNKFDQDALFGALKLAATLRPGETFSYKELPGVKLKMASKGVAIVSTMNPATVRYERKELDPALDRLFYDGKEKVDYPPMTEKSPELYEIFLGVLMDDNGRIRVAKEELTPAFVETPDSATGIIRQELDPNVQNHSVLYRFALATSEIHKSFTQKESVAKTATDEGFLEKTVLEMEVLVKWMNGYCSQVEGGDSLNTYLGKKLQEFHNNIDSETDRKIFERVFDHFGFDITHPQVTKKPNYTPLTPVEMGHLTPNTPRAVRSIGTEVVPATKLYIDPSTGEEINYLPTEIEIKEGKAIRSGDVLKQGEKYYRYLGIIPETQEELLVAAEASDLLPKVPATVEKGFEKAKKLFGENFLGEEAIHLMEQKCQASGINVKFEIPKVGNIFTDEMFKLLQEDKKNGRERLISMHPEFMTVNGKRKPVNLLNLRELFKKTNPFGNGAIFYDQNWYDNEDFAKQSLKAGFSLPTREILADSISKTWNEQQTLLLKGERRREAIEVLWDGTLYYATTGKKFLEDKYDWTQTRTSDGGLVGVGGFGSGGLGVSSWPAGSSHSYLGVCPSR